MQFNDIIGRILKSEGGYVNDPNDPGGETKYGISKRSYPNVDIAGLTPDAAAQIYYQDFWLKLHLDEFHLGVGYQILDASVLHGTTAATKMVQRAVGTTDDGVLGPATVEAVQNTDETALIMKFLAQRILFDVSLKKPEYLGGWMSRVADNLNYAVEDENGTN